MSKLTSAIDSLLTGFEKQAEEPQPEVRSIPGRILGLADSLIDKGLMLGGGYTGAKFLQNKDEIIPFYKTQRDLIRGQERAVWDKILAGKTVNPAFRQTSLEQIVSPQRMFERRWDLAKGLLRKLYSNKDPVVSAASVLKKLVTRGH